MQWRGQMHEHAGRLAIPRGRALIVAAALVVGSLLSGLAAGTANRFDAERERNLLAGETAIVKSRIERQTVQIRNALESVRPLWQLDSEPTRGDFQRFLDRGLRERTAQGRTAYDGLDSIGFIRAVEPGETADFLAQRRAERPDSYQDDLTEDTPHYVLDYSTSQAFLGTDLYPSEQRRLALERARDTGDATATDWSYHLADLHLPEAQRRRVSLLYLPVYPDGRVPELLALRRETIIGWLVGTTTAGELLDEASADLDVGLALNDDVGGADSAVAARNIAGAGTPRESFTLDVAGRQWHFEVTLPAGRVRSFVAPWQVFTIGMLLTCLVAALLWSLSRLHAQAEQRASSATARMRLSDQSLRALAEHVPIGMFDLGPDGTVQWVNSRTLELLGEHDRSAAEIDDWSSFIHPDDVEEVAATYRRCLTDKVGVHFRHRVRPQNGEVRWVEQRGTPIIDENGDLVRVVVSIDDVSGAVELEDRLTDARDAAVEASRLKSEFLANMSHEIRTPLNGVIGMANLLLEGDLEPEQRSRVATLRTAANQLLGLLNDILDLSKIEAGRLELETTTFDLREAIGDVMRLHSSAAHDKGIGFTSDIHQDVPALVTGDPVRIRQILDNLIGNAVKFTNEGQIRLEVSARQVSVRQAALRFDVRDTGVGISAEARRSIFRPFRQADASTTRQFGGTGLGLSICRQLVEMMDGELSVETTVGEGSCFTFAVTLTVERWDDEVPPPPAPELGDVGGPGGVLDTELRLLLVEDNIINQQVALGLLAAKGWAIDVANNGIEAVEAVESANAADSPYDAILMDCQMPRMDGYEATQRIRRIEGDRRHTPIVALTAAAMKGDRERCFAAGMDDYVSKPVSVAALEDALARRLAPEPSRPSPRVVTDTDDADGPGADDGADDAAPDVINWRAVHELSVIDGLLQRSAARFLEYSPVEIGELRNTVARRDFAQAKAIAHKLKGSSATVGVARLAAALAEIEAACDRAPETVPDLLPQLDELYSEGSEALAAAAAQPDAAAAAHKRI